MTPDLIIFRDLSTAVEQGNELRVGDLVQQALAVKISPLEILNQGLLPAMERVGERFARDELFIPEVMMSAKSLQAGIDLLRPYFAQGDLVLRGKIVLGTVAGDVHDIGKNLVGMIFLVNGYQVVDLGVNVARDTFVAAIAEHRPDFLGMSALLTTTMAQMEKTVRALEAAGMRQDVFVMVGGAPVDADFAREIGADCYAEDALEAVVLARRVQEQKAR